jgi:hypothetical protein
VEAVEAVLPHASLALAAAACDFGAEVLRAGGVEAALAILRALLGEGGIGPGRGAGGGGKTNKKGKGKGSRRGSGGPSASAAAAEAELHQAAACAGGVPAADVLENCVLLLANLSADDCLAGCMVAESMGGGARGVRGGGGGGGGPEEDDAVDGPAGAYAGGECELARVLLRVCTASHNRKALKYALAALDACLDHRAGLRGGGGGGGSFRGAAVRLGAAQVVEGLINRAPDAKVLQRAMELLEKLQTAGGGGEGEPEQPVGRAGAGGYPGGLPLVRRSESGPLL